MFHALRSSEESETINVIYSCALLQYVSLEKAGAGMITSRRRCRIVSQECMSDIAFAEKMYSSNQGCVVPA